MGETLQKKWATSHFKPTASNRRIYIHLSYCPDFFQNALIKVRQEQKYRDKLMWKKCFN